MEQFWQLQGHLKVPPLMAHTFNVTYGQFADKIQFWPESGIEIIDNSIHFQKTSCHKV